MHDLRTRVVRTPWEAHVIDVLERTADTRRRMEFEGDDPVFW